MKAKKKKIVEITLVLNKREAEWLKDYMQNQLYDEESNLDIEMRAKIFETLKKELE